MEREHIPRMRTAAKIVSEIKALDTDTEVTEFHICKPKADVSGGTDLSEYDFDDEDEPEDEPEDN